MDGFDQSNETPSRPPWRTIALIVGAVVLAVGLVVLALVFVRGRRSVSVDQQNLARVETQLEQSLSGCAQEADPDACREQKVRIAAEATGAESLCGYLEGEPYDECVWTLAREQNDADLCGLIKEEGKAATCADSILLKTAMAELDADLCADIASAETRASCEEAVAGPLTRANCLERKDADYCAQFDLYVSAREKQDPDMCAQITDADLASTCVEIVTPGDRDFDGLDADEEALLGSSDRSTDSDADGLSDADETNAYGTDPANADTDGDGYTDGSEVQNGYNPNGPGTL